MADFLYMLTDNLTYNLEKSRKASHLIGNLISSAYQLTEILICHSKKMTKIVVFQKYCRIAKKAINMG